MTRDVKELARDLEFAIDVTEPREVILRRFEEILLGAPRPSPAPREEQAWLIELGTMPPQWWTGRGDEWTACVDGTPDGTGRGTTKADHAIRFARREDAERALIWRIPESCRRGCKVTEHLWLGSAGAAPPVPQQGKTCAHNGERQPSVDDEHAICMDCGARVPDLPAPPVPQGESK